MRKERNEALSFFFQRTACVPPLPWLCSYRMASDADRRSLDDDGLSEAVKSCWIAGNGIFDPESMKAAEQQQRRREGKDPDGHPPPVRDSLKAQWELATKGLSGTSEGAAARLGYWFDRLWLLHSPNSSRRYHTTVHLYEMLEYLKLLRAGGCKPVQRDEDLTLVVLSIFFHDAVYDGTSSTNEEDSAKLFETFAEELAVPPALKTAVVDCILATKKHNVNGDDSSCSSPLALFLDLDMAVLGKHPTAYRRYAALIRGEYDFVPHGDYCTGRAAVLEGFLRQPRVYGTRVVHGALEERARANLRHEIESLRKGVIPGGGELEG